MSTDGILNFFNLLVLSILVCDSCRNWYLTGLWELHGISCADSLDSKMPAILPNFTSVARDDLMGTYPEDEYCIRHCLQVLYNLVVLVWVAMAVLLLAAVSLICME